MTLNNDLVENDLLGNERPREELVEEYGEDAVKGAEKAVRDDKAEEIGKAMGIDPELLKAYASNPADVDRLAQLIGEDRAAFLISRSQAEEGSEEAKATEKTWREEEAERLKARYPTMEVHVEEESEPELSEELKKRYPTMVKKKEKE